MSLVGTQRECRRTAWRVCEQSYIDRTEGVGGPGEDDPYLPKLVVLKECARFQHSLAAP